MKKIGSYLGLFGFAEYLIVDQQNEIARVFDLLDDLNREKSENHGSDLKSVAAHFFHLD